MERLKIFWAFSLNHTKRNWLSTYCKLFVHGQTDSEDKLIERLTKKVLVKKNAYEQFFHVFYKLRMTFCTCLNATFLMPVTRKNILNMKINHFPSQPSNRKSLSFSRPWECIYRKYHSSIKLKKTAMKITAKTLQRPGVGFVPGWKLCRSIEPSHVKVVKKPDS